MRPRHVAKFVRDDCVTQYLVIMRNGNKRFYDERIRGLPPTVAEWLEWHTASGDVTQIDGGLIYHYSD